MGNVPSPPPFISAANELRRRLTGWNQSAKCYLQGEKTSPPAEAHSSLTSGGFRGRGLAQEVTWTKQAVLEQPERSRPSAGRRCYANRKQEARRQEGCTAGGGGRRSGKQTAVPRDATFCVQSGSSAGTNQRVAPPSEGGRLINAANAANWLPAAPAHMNN